MPNADRWGSPIRRPSGLLSIEDSIKSRLVDPNSTGRNLLNCSCRIVMTLDGRPLRTVITGRRHIVTGSYPSRKARRAFPHEGMNELAFFMHSEVDTTVVDYRAQPFRFEFTLDGRPRIYIADCVRQLDTGALEVVEVKNDWRALRDADYAAKLARVGEVCRSLGWNFRVVTRSALTQPPIFHANVKEVQSRRTVRHDASHIYRASALIAREGGVAPLGVVADALGERLQGRAIVKALMVGRVADIVLNRRLTDDSEVRLVRDADAHLQFSEVR
ncbi:TnsA endonuclease N-terminal domain-containing protein [Caulobacter sp. BE254]|uniref:TnsA endonuclease N-terminal domain-containing protein n=1 Tax=Caulobacter sp. BE254 TaxID=2817720 RepID=UPI0028617DBF|nr:TnsA endonuclease N-terminal domain-containing protein [Caulobacter sp. BE254]MDR7115620.1 hypothetical protein [Caulobacter sp. BE254]